MLEGFPVLSAWLSFNTDDTPVLELGDVREHQKEWAGVLEAVGKLHFGQGELFHSTTGELCAGVVKAQAILPLSDHALTITAKLMMNGRTSVTWETNRRTLTTLHVTQISRRTRAKLRP